MQNLSELTRNIREVTQNFWYIDVYANQNSRTIGQIYTKQIMLTKESKLFKNEGVRLHSTGDYQQTYFDNLTNLLLKNTSAQFEIQNEISKFD